MTHPIRLALCAVALFACGQIAAAEPVAADYRRLNLDLVDHHIVPRYAQLAETTARLEEAVVRHCRALDTDGPAALDEAWREAFDAWQGVQHLRFGPGELFMRSMRMQFWPDPRNTVGRQLDELVAAGDPAVLEAERFARLSIAVQGFPAIERLLADGPAPVGGDYRCAVLEAVAGNVADMAADTLQEWQGGERSYRTMVAEAAKGAAHYHQDSEVTQALFKSLHGLMELLAEHKLNRPLGDSPQAARPQLAESWRGKRSLDNLRINLEAAEAMYVGENGGNGFSHFVREVRGDVALDDLLRRAFVQTRATAASIALPLEEAVIDRVERKKLAKLLREASALKTLLAQRLTVALGIPLGFNSLDGD
jgi:uncharacterized protein